MSAPTASQLVTQLAGDLAWLEGFASERDDLHHAVVPLRLSAALLRNQVGPFLADRPVQPLHVAVVGGAGTGKSTVANFLLGRQLAEANPQAGFTRHPVAYVAHDSQAVGQLVNGILGPLLSIPGPTPSDRDEDVFQVRQVATAQGAEAEPIHQAVVWDCPDMTTWKANQYQTRLVETIGLADLIVYVASDERYNDAWPTQYLRYILQAGKPVIACLTKMQNTQVETLLKHFREQVIARIPECAGVSAVVALPSLTMAEQADPNGVGTSHRQRLLEPVQWWLKQPHKTRHDSVNRAVRFLGQFQETLLAPARHDLKDVATWEGWVQAGQQTFISRYRNEHLMGEQFPHFAAAMLRLMELLELPGIGQYISMTMNLLRSPYRWVKSMFKTPASQGPAEVQILQASFQGWVDQLRLELLQQDEKRPVWAALRDAYHQQRDRQLFESFNSKIAGFVQLQAQETETTARAIYEELEKRPASLNTLRGLKFSVEAVSLTGVVFTAGAHLLLYPVLMPLVASVTQGVTEAVGKQYVDAQREKARSRLQQLFTQSLAEPMAASLSSWPGELVPTLPRLREIATRLPDGLKTLLDAVLLNKKEAA